MSACGRKLTSTDTGASRCCGSGCAVIVNAMSTGGVMRQAFLGMCVLGTLAFAQVSFAQETAKKELREHPRIAAAIRELHGAIEYMERAPHDFGGHKAQAIADSRKGSVPAIQTPKSSVRKAAD